MSKELTEEYMNSLAKKYKAKDWYWVTSNTMLDDDGKIHSVQMVKDVEELFKLGKNKVVNIYTQRYPLIGGFITED